MKNEKKYFFPSIVGYILSGITFPYWPIIPTIIIIICLFLKQKEKKNNILKFNIILISTIISIFLGLLYSIYIFNKLDSNPRIFGQFEINVIIILFNIIILILLILLKFKFKGIKITLFSIIISIISYLPSFYIDFNFNPILKIHKNNLRLISILCNEYYSDYKNYPDNLNLLIENKYTDYIPTTPLYNYEYIYIINKNNNDIIIICPKEELPKMKYYQKKINNIYYSNKEGLIINKEPKIYD
ncbi:MAG: hypothetical protein PHV06_05635 [bacterium]|nr:hypothetical protein [bacterium]